MTKTIKEFKEVYDQTDFDFPILLSFEKGKWYRTNDEIHWNDDNNLEDLYNGDGNTYCGWMPEGFSEKDGYLVTNVDTETGCWMTSLFELSDEVKYEDLEEMFE